MSWAEQRRDWYASQRRKPQWQKKRLEIMERDGWRCRSCHSPNETLNVHHQFYTKGAKPWEYPDDALITLCEECHVIETNDREAAENDLLMALKLRGFVVSDIDRLAEGFQNLALKDTWPGYLSGLIAETLEDAAEIKGIADRSQERWRQEVYGEEPTDAAKESPQTLDKP